MVKCHPQGDEKGGDVDEEGEDREAMAIVDGHDIAVGMGISKYCVQSIEGTSGLGHIAFIYALAAGEEQEKLRETEGSPTDSLSGK